MHFDSDHANMMFFKYCVNDDACYSVVDFTKRSRGRPSNADIELPLLYPALRPVQRKKLVDLKALLSFVPPIHHRFYKQLKCASGNDEDDDDNEGANIWTESDTDIDSE